MLERKVSNSFTREIYIVLRKGIYTTLCSFREFLFHLRSRARRWKDSVQYFTNILNDIQINRFPINSFLVVSIRNNETRDTYTTCLTIFSSLRADPYVFCQWTKKMENVEFFFELWLTLRRKLIKYNHVVTYLAWIIAYIHKYQTSKLYYIFREKQLGRNI